MTELRDGKWFAVAEMACHDGTPYPEEEADRLVILFSQLDLLRDRWGGPLRVVSGFRSDVYNARIGGARLSRHVAGDAVDLQPIVKPAAMVAAVKRLHELAETMVIGGALKHVGGLGYYAGKWIHLDCRPKPPSGHVALWTGAGLGSEA